MKHLETPKSRLYFMMLIRAFELRISEAFANGKLAGTMFHLSVGQEATAVGASSVVTSKPAIRGRVKTGQRSSSGT
jgi:TPP-dependent pyruvate/acetoin dehydrogenase alpha subunit